jgi:hypothetical protein
LFSTGKALQNGFNIFLEKGKTKIIFDRIMRTSKVFIVGIEVIPSVSGKVAVTALDKGKRVNIKVLHGMFTHVGEDCTCKTAKHYKWDFVGKT